MSDAQSEKVTLAAVFRRRGANGQHTRLFDDLEESQRQTLLGYAPLSGDELPIVGSLEGPDRWFVLTTRKLIWRRAGATTALSLDKIIDAIVDLQALQASGTTKLNNRELQVITPDRHYTIDVEPGAPFSGFWNVLKGIGVGNRGSKKGQAIS
jgi:hypothetical protein